MDKEFLKKLDEALGITEAADKPKLPKPDGKQEKTGKGAHKHGEQTDFTQMKPEDKMSNIKYSKLTTKT